MWQQICVDVIKLSSWAGFKALNCLLTRFFVAICLSTLQMRQISDLLLLGCADILCVTGIKTWTYEHGFSPVTFPFLILLCSVAIVIQSLCSCQNLATEIANNNF